MVEYNPFGSEVLDNPFPFYAELREQCPVHRYDDYTHPLYTATRYDDVVELLTTVDTWSSQWGQMPTYEDRGCLFSDPPVPHDVSQDRSDQLRPSSRGPNAG